MGRRGALGRFLAASAAIVVGGLPAGAEPPTLLAASEFSESPTSEASIARMRYDGREDLPPPPPPPPPPAPVAAAGAGGRAAKADFDGNEAGSVGAADEGTKSPIKGAVLAKSSIPTNVTASSLEPKVSVPLTNNQIVGGGVILFGFMALAAGNDEETEAGGSTTAVPVMTGASPPTQPYGLSGGRNNNVVAEAPPPPPPAAPKAAEVAVSATPKWKLEKPVPYGIQNANGRNPFVTEVLEYCEGGKVTEDCVDTIKGFLDDLADTGAAATTDEVRAIVGYIDTLGPDSSPSSGPDKRRVGAAFASYLDALSAGSAPPPSSAKAVKTYLDSLNGTAGAVAGSAAMRGGAAAAAALAPDYLARYDDRLTGIEGRVSTLEAKVDDLPDRVFEKIEAWQTRQEGRLAGEVGKIVDALASAAVAPPPPAVVVEPPPAAEAHYHPPAAAAPVAPPESVIVPASPLGAAIPERIGVPRAGAAAAGPRGGYRFGGGGSSWKSSDDGRPGAAATGAAVPGGADLRSAVPKKFAVGGGAGWKTGKPKGGGGYLDNMKP